MTKKIYSSKNNFLLFNSSLAAAVFQQVHPANTVTAYQWWRAIIGQSAVAASVWSGSEFGL